MNGSLVRMVGIGSGVGLALLMAVGVSPAWNHSTSPRIVSGPAQTQPSAATKVALATQGGIVTPDIMHWA